MSKSRFAMVSEAMLSDTRLTGRQFKVLVALRMFADSKTGEAHPKKSQIADVTGLHERKIAEDTAALVELGWIEKKGCGGRSTSAIYTLRNEPQTMTKTGINNDDQNSHGLKKETMTVSGKNHDRFGLKTMTVSGQNHDRNGHTQVTDQQQTIEQTNNRPVAAGQQTALVLAAQNHDPADAGSPPDRLTEFQDVCRMTWTAYATAYAERYGINPVRNAKVNTQVVQFCKRVPHDEAPHIAAFYAKHNGAFYVGRGHLFGNLLADAEKLRTEWATGRVMTATTARQIDGTQSNLNAIEQAVALAAGRQG